MIDLLHPIALTMYIDGGWMLTDHPEHYHEEDVITDGKRYAVWHSTEMKDDDE